jgi:hypothetical protein
MSVNGRLPCPADPALPVGHANAGRENCRPNNVAYPTLACNATNSLCRIEGARSFVFPAAGTTVLGTVPANTGPERVLRGAIPYATLGLAPREASIQAMKEVSGAVIAVALVLATASAGSVACLFRQQSNIPTA